MYFPVGRLGRESGFSIIYVVVEEVVVVVVAVVIVVVVVLAAAVAAAAAATAAHDLKHLLPPLKYVLLHIFCDRRGKREKEGGREGRQAQKKGSQNFTPAQPDTDTKTKKKMM